MERVKRWMMTAAFLPMFAASVFAVEVNVNVKGSINQGPPIQGASYWCYYPDYGKQYRCCNRYGRELPAYRCGRRYL